MDPNLAAALLVLTQAMTAQTERNTDTQRLLVAQQTEIARLVAQVARNGERPTTVVLQNIPLYSGGIEESLEDWEVALNRAAATEY